MQKRVGLLMRAIQLEKRGNQGAALRIWRENILETCFRSANKLFWQKKRKIKISRNIPYSSYGNGCDYGGDGYTFQDRYIVCHIPRWVTDEGFVHIMSEASGDVDVVYIREGGYKYDHITGESHCYC